MKEIGQRVKLIRKRNDLNQVQFSESIGISQGNLSEIEQGHSNPSAETLISIGLKYRVNIEWLLLGSNRENTFFHSEAEELLLISYRELSKYDQAEILEIIQVKKRLNANNR